MYICASRCKNARCDEQVAVVHYESDVKIFDFLRSFLVCHR